jgi:peptide/nickel transport system permease protein
VGFRAFLLKRLATMAVVLIAVASINFFLFQVLPFTVLRIDPKQWFVPVVNPQAVKNTAFIQAEQAKVIAQLGLNLPLQERYFVYLKAMFTFNFGYNVGSQLQGPVSNTILTFAPYTVLLLGTSTIAAFLIGIYLGVYSAARRGKWQDKTSFVTSLFFFAMPSFWIGTILLLAFAYDFHVFPSNAAVYFGSANLTGLAYVGKVLYSMILPFTSLTLISVGGVYLIMRSTSIDVTTEDYILMARAKGLKERAIIYKHVLRNAILPQVTNFALSVAFILSGAIITETVFGWPGLGYWTFQAVNSLDFPLEQGLFFVIAVMVVVANFLSDILYGYFDPRIRAS